MANVPEEYDDADSWPGVTNWPSTVASIVNFVRLTTVRSLTLSVQICRTKLTTRRDDKSGHVLQSATPAGEPARHLVRGFLDH